jgi:small-conductance mechanosensitive channel
MLIHIPGTTLVRDTETMALINKDTTGQQEYYNRRNKMAAEKEQINKIKTEVQSLKDDVNDIKELLHKILENQING